MDNMSVIPDSPIGGPSRGPMGGGPGLQEIFFIQGLFMNIILPICLTCAFFGSVVNIIVFINLGLADSMVVSFLALSSSDLAYILTSMLTLAINGIGFARLPWPFPVQSFALAGVIAWYKYLSYDVSLYMTTYIAVARCCCVLMPLKFKGVFTVKVTVVVFAIIVGVNTSMRAPLLASQGLWFKPNATRLTVWYGEHWETLQAVHDIANQTILTNTCLFVVCLCMVLLIYKLAQASRVRQTMIGGKSPWRSEVTDDETTDGATSQSRRGGERERDIREETGEDARDWNQDEREASTSSNHVSKPGAGSTGNSFSAKATTDSRSKVKPSPASSVLSGRELQVVQAVVLVAGFFMVAVLFSSAQAVARRIEPRFDNAGRFRHLFTISNLTGYALTFAHSGLNPFIYFRYNSRYRRVVQGWFSCAAPSK